LSFVLILYITNTSPFSTPNPTSDTHTPCP
jgi:hypothetical protein